MESFNGQDMLHVFEQLNIDLNDLNPNVIGAWFDTDCPDTKNALNWMCSSLNSNNYLSPQWQAEYDSLDNHLSYNDCLKELHKLDPAYVDVFNNEYNSEDIKLMEDEIEVLETECEYLDNLISAAEEIEHNLYSELHRKKNIITSNLSVDCKQKQKECEQLCENLTDINVKIEKQLNIYNMNDCFNNYIDIDEFQDSINTLKLILKPPIINDDFCSEVEKTLSSYNPEIYQKRILNSTNVYLSNKIEIGKLKGILNYLINISSPSIQRLEIESDEINDSVLKQRNDSLFEMLNKMALDITDTHLNDLRMIIAQNKFDEFQSQLRFITETTELVKKFFEYFRLISALQLCQNISIENVINIYQKIRKFVNEDLYKCQKRINLMENIIEDHKSYISSHKNDNKFLDLIKDILGNESHKSLSLLNVVENFQNQLDQLEREIFSNHTNIINNTIAIKKDIQTLQHFIMGGPTDRIILVSLEFQKICQDLEKHIKKEKNSVIQAIQIISSANDKLTPAQRFSKNLWISFLTNPTGIDSIFREVEKKCLEQ